MNQIEKANAACALANMSMRVAIRALKAAIVEMKEMRENGEVPVDCIDALNDHIANLKYSKNSIRQMVLDHKQTCVALTNCLEGGGVITPQDGGGK